MAAYETKRYGADKIALLAFFIAALSIAQLITFSRSAVSLSEPVRLDYANLSVSIPAGYGWQSDKKWRYNKNSFTLSSFFNPGSASLVALAHCRYFLAAVDIEADAIFEQKASAFGGLIVEKSQIQTENFTIDWVHIAQKKKSPFGIFFGTVALPNNRRLDIEVQQAAYDADLARNTFEAIAKSLKFKENKLLNAGAEIVVEIKRKGISSLLPDRNIESFFLITDTAKRTIGFMTEAMVDSKPPAQLNIHTASYIYIRGRFVQEQASLFQSNDSFDQFRAESEVVNMARRTGTKIALGKDGVMTVSKVNVFAKDENYRPGPAAIPDAFTEQLFSQMLDSSYEKILVDIIESNGKIVPVLISRIEPDNTDAAKQRAAFVLTTEFLDGTGFSQRVYLDSQKKVSKILLQQDRLYISERTSLKNILNHFPEQADHILYKSKIPNSI